jgi:hypothetical protein
VFPWLWSTTLISRSFPFWIGEKSDISDVNALSSLRRLNSLRIGCGIAIDAFPALVKFKALRHLYLADLHDHQHPAYDLSSILPVIGRNLISLDANWELSYVDGLVQHCPNIQFLDLYFVGVDKSVCRMIGQIFKDGLKGLMVLRINENSIRLGVDYEEL